MINALHRAIVGLIRMLPLRQAAFCFRAYNKLLKLSGRGFVGRTYFGSRMHCDPNDLIQRMILHFGVWEPDVSRAIEQRLAPGDVFVDIGANVGYDALLAARKVGPEGRVVAIEASPSTFALLTRNLALNDAANVRAVQAAVSDRRGTLELYEPFAGNIGAMTTVAARGGRHVATVEALPLEEILRPDEIARLRLIKLDVEGAEPPILLRLIGELARYPKAMDIVVEASPADDAAAWQAVFDGLRAAGFRAFAIENSYELEWYLARRQPSPLAERFDVPQGQQDLLFTRSA